MSQAPVLKRKSSRQCLHLSAVDWKTYTRLLNIFGERPGYHLTYDRGELEIMSPSMEHDKESRFLGRLIVATTEELGLPLICGGSFTLRRRRRRRGAEADESYWITNAHRIAGRRRLDLRTDPPPDLAVEVDVSRSSLDRLAIYAALGIAEVWQLDGDVLTFHVLGPDATYASAAVSRAFPLVTPADLLRFVQLARQADDNNEVVRQYREWLRQQLGSTGIPPATP